MLPYEGEEEEEEARNSHGGKEEEGDFQEAFGNLLVGRGSLLLAAYQWRGCPPQICDLPRMPQEPGCPLVGAGGGEPGRSPVGNVP